MQSLQPAGTQPCRQCQSHRDFQSYLTLNKAEQGAVDREIDKLQSLARRNKSLFYSFALPEEVEAVQLD